jgi:rod shape-determining protein MreC
VYAFGTRIRSALDAAGRSWRGDDPVAALREENERLRTGVAQANELMDENAFLRRVSDLPARRDRMVVDAGVFAYGVGGNAIRMVVNRGAGDGVVPGATVTTGGGTLVGVVEAVQERTASVRVVGDTSFQVTARVRGTDINGLVRRDATGELILDLIAKDELVAEGAVVESSGLDRVPAGLLVGTVRSIDAGRTTLFQVIRLDAAHREQPITRVLILSP